MIDSILTQVIAVQKERGASYGDFKATAENQGKIWAGILSAYLETSIPPLPAHVVHMMMAGMKLARASSPTHQGTDSYIDAVSYVDLAERSVR